MLPQGILAELTLHGRDVRCLATIAALSRQIENGPRSIFAKSSRVRGGIFDPSGSIVSCAPASGRQGVGRGREMVSLMYPPDLVSELRIGPLDPLKKARQHVSVRTTELPGRWGAFDVQCGSTVGSCGVRKKTRGRAGTPDAGALFFNELRDFTRGSRVTPPKTPGKTRPCLKDIHFSAATTCVKTSLSAASPSSTAIGGGVDHELRSWHPSHGRYCIY